MIKEKYRLKSLNIGQIETHVYENKTFESAIKKRSVDEPVYLTKTGLTGDEQAYKFHGGEDKALCLYPFDYYAYWRNHLKNFVNNALFGENLTAIGLKEDNAHIGDVFTFGEAIIQVSEPRNPCYKLAEKYEVPDMVTRMRETGYTGFLLRVLKEGVVSKEDDLILLEADPKKISVSFVNEVKFNDRFNKRKIESILEIDGLSESLRTTLLKQYESKKANDWS